jgi:hypothetical protein
VFLNGEVLAPLGRGHVPVTGAVPHREVGHEVVGHSAVPVPRRIDSHKPPIDGSLLFRHRRQAGRDMRPASDAQKSRKSARHASC